MSDKAIRCEHTPTPRIDWRPSREYDCAAAGYCWGGREVTIWATPDEYNNAAWRVIVNRGTSVIEAERIVHGTLEDAKELGAWMASDISRHDETGIMLAVRIGYAILPRTLTHIDIIDDHGNVYENVPICCAWALIERLFNDAKGKPGASDDKRNQVRRKVYAWLMAGRRHEYPQGAPVPKELHTRNEP